MNPFETYWTTKQIAERTHTTTDGVKKWLAKGLLKRTKACGKTLISESDFQQFLRDSTNKAAA